MLALCDKISDGTLKSNWAMLSWSMYLNVQLFHRASTVPRVVSPLDRASQRGSRLWARSATPAMHGELFKYGDGSSHAAFVSGRHSSAYAALANHVMLRCTQFSMPCRAARRIASCRAHRRSHRRPALCWVRAISSAMGTTCLGHDARHSSGQEVKLAVVSSAGRWVAGTAAHWRIGWQR